MHRDLAINREDWLFSQNLGRREALATLLAATSSFRAHLIHGNSAIVKYYPYCLAGILLGKNVMTPISGISFLQLSAQKILRQDFEDNFGFSFALYNEAEHENGRDMTENSYSPTSVLRRDLLAIV